MKATEDVTKRPEVIKEIVTQEIQEVKNTKEDKSTKFKPGVGVDVGTSNIVVARQTEDGTFTNRFHRDMLYPLDISDESADLLDRSDYLYVKVSDKYYIVGEDALRLVNAIGKGEVVRPMKDGILNPLSDVMMHCKARDYAKADNSYLLLAIGKAAWPMGVTSVGIHERAAREKISTGETAHVLNDEKQRKYIQSVKRLITYSQKKWPGESGIAWQ